jgi:hypothetical protein
MLDDSDLQLSIIVTLVQYLPFAQLFLKSQANPFISNENILLFEIILYVL